MKDISPAELEVLKILWQQAPQTANQVVDTLADASQWHENGAVRPGFGPDRLAP